MQGFGCPDTNYVFCCSTIQKIAKAVKDKEGSRVLQEFAIEASSVEQGEMSASCARYA